MNRNVSFVSIIIPVYNDGDRLKLCLTALEKQTYNRDDFEVIVVDNGSEQDIKAVTDMFKRVRYEQEKCPGSSAARNKGLLSAQGEILAFTDADCIPAVNWIENGVRAMKSSLEDILVAGRVDYHFMDPLYPTMSELYDSTLYLRSQIDMETFHVIATANLFTYKRIFNVIGYFDDAMKYRSDFEWTLRAYWSNYRQIYVDDAVVSHAAKNSLRELFKRVNHQTLAEYIHSKRNEKWLKDFFSNYGIMFRWKLFFKDIIFVLTYSKIEKVIDKIKVLVIMSICSLVGTQTYVQAFITDKILKQPLQYH